MDSHVCQVRRRGHKTPSKTHDTNLDSVFVKNTLVMENRIELVTKPGINWEPSRVLSSSTWGAVGERQPGNPVRFLRVEEEPVGRLSVMAPML